MTFVNKHVQKQTLLGNANGMFKMISKFKRQTKSQKYLATREATLRVKLSGRDVIRNTFISKIERKFGQIFAMTNRMTTQKWPLSFRQIVSWKARRVVG